MDNFRITLQFPRVAASCEKIQQMYENLARSLDFRLLFARTEAYLESGLSARLQTTNQKVPGSIPGLTEGWTEGC